MSEPQEETPESESGREEVTPERCRVVRVGHGANCSSIGSVIDTLFLGATLGGAILAAVCAAMKDEAVTVVGRKPAAATDRDERDGNDAGDAS